MSIRHSLLVSCLAANVFAVAWPITASADDPIRFSLQIRPILADNCFHCHGPDETHREAELRLDDETSAKARRDEGAAIVPGKPNESALVKRITSSDPDFVMPPPDTNKKLKPEQIVILKKWIEQGAPWGKHWSFEPPQKVPLPEVRQQDWPQSPIDHFVLAELEKRNLAPAPPADPLVLCRRISLDLIGLPPSPLEADAFAAAFAKDRQAAVRELVDRLLQSPRFGEHWARMWLDLARYADTKGYEKDLHRDMWPYRDWVIEALNADMPLDQFTREQLAGDLLDGASERQLVATAFHRNTMTNDEGGTDDEEFRMTAVKDRIDTTVQVWMGLTMGCAKCHSHKYDPITHVDYYRFYAIFNQTEDNDRYDDGPTLPLPSAEQKERRQKLDEQIVGLKGEVKHEEESAAGLTAEAEKKWQPQKASEAKSTGGATLSVQDDGSITAEGASPETDVYELTLKPAAGKYTALRIEALPLKLSNGKQGLGRNPDDPNFVISELVVERIADGKEPMKLTLKNPRADFSQDGWNVTAAIDGDTQTGWAVSPQRDQRHVALFDFDSPLEIADGATLKVSLSQQYGNRLTLAKFRLSLSTATAAELNPVPTTPKLAQLKKDLDAAQSQRSDLEKQIVKLPIYRELAEDKRRITKIHNRGNFLDPGDEVQPDVPAAFGPLPEGAPQTRLGVAQWLTSKDNPLTPRVMANRVWARLFGLGIVETEEDFGAQGSPPSHPFLLDWLAVHYRDDCRWSLKSLIRSIVTSSAYQQAFVLDAARREHDPRNVWLSRGSRQRLSAEVVRDQALAISGLLSAKMGGPSVMPPQPDGLWKSTYNASKWVTSSGADRYRRGIYTYWKRTTPYPSMITFDAGSREVCLVRRIHTNTPLQALVTLNDPVYLEAAAALAKRMIQETDHGENCKAALGLRLALTRMPTGKEIELLVKLYHEALADLSSRPDAAEALLKEANATPPAGVAASEHAAWTVAASAILNLDELLMRN